MTSSLDPGSLYQTLMTLYQIALSRYRGPKLSTGEPHQDPQDAFKLARLAKIFTAGANIGEMMDATDDSGAPERLTLAEIALMSEILTQIGPLGHMPSDLGENIVALLNDFEIKAPALAIRLRNELTEARRKTA